MAMRGISIVRRYRPRQLTSLVGDLGSAIQATLLVADTCTHSAGKASNTQI